MTLVTVCQLDGRHRDQEWERLCAHVREHGSDLLVLPELPFSPWLPARREADPHAWEAAAAAHEEWIGRLGELGAGTVVVTRPTLGDARLNEGIVWTAETGAEAAHAKTFLPDEEGFYEASWYDRGPVRFHPVDTPAGRLGLLICTELWFTEHARAYGKAGVTLLAVPRATPVESADRWLAAGRTAAVCSGAFLLSSNQAGEADGVTMAGGGWIISPDGEVLAVTDESSPFATLDVDLDVARAAKQTYPRYVDDGPLD